MPRVVGRAASGRAVLSDSHSRGNSPQSTLAAQLVNRFKDGPKQSRTQDRETFNQLLREVLANEREQHALGNTNETDNSVNFKLIYVIVKAGLELDDLFGRNGCLSQQAIDSLLAIKRTLQKNPDVLYFVPSNEDLDVRFDGPLFLWLIPNLLAVLSHSVVDQSIKCVIEVLEAALTIDRAAYRPEAKVGSLLEYIKRCVKDTLHRVEVSASGLLGVGSLPLLVPSTTTIATVYPQFTLQNHSHLTVQVACNTIREARFMTVCLLSILVNITSCYQKSNGVTSRTVSEDDWLFVCLTRTWSIFATETAPSQSHNLSTPELAVFLESVYVFLGRITKLNFHDALSARFFSLLSQIMDGLLGYEPLQWNSPLEKSVCLLLLKACSRGRKSYSVHQAIVQYLLPAVSELLQDETRYSSLCPDLRHAIHLIKRIHSKPSHLEPQITSRDQSPGFQDPDVQHHYRKYFSCTTPSSPNSDVERPSKKPRLSIASSTSPLDFLERILSNICSISDLASKKETTDLQSKVIDCFSGLSEDDQCFLYSQIGYAACAGAKTLRNVSHHEGGCEWEVQCRFCDDEVKGQITLPSWEGHKAEEMFSTLMSLVKLPRVQSYKRARVAAMLALRRLLSHTSSSEHLNLSTSPSGQWCLQALRSSVRELRIAAGRTLPIFLFNASAVSLAPKNRAAALEYLRSLSDRSDLALQETSISAWGQIARVTNSDEMNLILLKLVEYLGHTNAFICALAYDEIQKMSNHSPFSAMKLFAPYWRTIAVTVAKDLYRRPQVAQQISDILAISVSEFLLMTQVHTVPFFVLTKQQDILQRIANASGQSIMVLCRSHKILPATLSCILLKTSGDMGTMVMNLLNAVSPEFGNVDCAELLKSEPQATAAELLKVAGEDSDDLKDKAHQAIQFLAGVTQEIPASSKGSARKTDVVGRFFENHVLGIMALLADTINDEKRPQPILEKVRCLGAIREMVVLAKSYISNGMPQICACLRSAIENADLSNASFAAWNTMMNSLREEEIATLVSPTFAILAQFWDAFLPQVQARAYDMVESLLKSHPSMMRNIGHTLPSLAAIPLMAKFEEDLVKLKGQVDVKHRFQAFERQCRNENPTVVLRTLDELENYLVDHQSYLHENANSEQPDPVVSRLIRSILDTSIVFNNTQSDIAILCAKCLGHVGCLDPTRIEAVRENREILVLSNFNRDEETNDFIVFFLQEVLVKAFLSASNSRSQGFLAYAMQELLAISEIRESVKPYTRDGALDANHRRWISLPESIRTTLLPFTGSKYFVTAGVAQPPSTYPLYNATMTYGQWLRVITFNLLKRKVGDGKAQDLFSVLSRIIRFQDISISSFLIPFACLNAIVSGSDREKLEIGQELHLVLNQPLSNKTSSRDDLILCSQTVFQVLDYLSRWMQEKKKNLANVRTPGSRTGRLASEAELERDALHIQSVDSVLAMIPADVMARRAVECRSYSRALFHWEQFIRQRKDFDQVSDAALEMEPLFVRLQEIYTQIDEPDGIEGISAHLQVLNIDQQILEHRKAGRWTAVQSWYELLLTEKPGDANIQSSLLTSLKESGQYDVLLNQIEGFQHSDTTRALALPFATEASWITGKWDKLRKYTSAIPDTMNGTFNIGIGQALLALSSGCNDQFSAILDRLRYSTLRDLTTTNTASLQECHDSLLKFHALTEIEMIARVRGIDDSEKSSLAAMMSRRLDVLGPFVSNKQYLLGLRRAAMQLSKDAFATTDIASAWLTSAKLARKGGFMHQAFNAVLHASKLGDESATIEHSRLLWQEGNHRKAIQSLEGAIAANAFKSHDYTEALEPVVTNNTSRRPQQNLLKARAHLLLAKWIDKAGQSQSDVTIQQYKKAVDCQNRWEKGHYYLGKHYNKLLESEKAKPPWKQAQTFITGETAKLVVENYLRSLAFGAKYIYQTLPRILTLWLDLASESDLPLDPKYGSEETFRAHTTTQRRKLLGACNSQIKKYIDRLPAFVYYTALSQLVARICHPNQSVYQLLVDIVAKVVTQHTPQALWTLLAVVKSSSKDRANRGLACMTKVLENSKKARADSAGQELRSFISQGQRLSDQLLQVCEADMPGKATNVSLSRDLCFNHKSAFSKLAIPLEISLTVSLPTVTNGLDIKRHKAFNSQDYIHISTFLDDVLILNSLQRPRKISLRGSDGHTYALLCKPKDDLRKDQRLMEFNAMINRALKRDADASRRRLYIKTYAVTPLNEECGLIEWVDNLKTLREILLTTYKQKNVQINYNELRMLLNESISAPDKLTIFTDKVLPHFPPVFHEWFIEMFSEPGAWFNARLRYTRSCAVMSIVGHVLGLGDRHGENILFEEGNGGTFHVDFNCLFDKGLTFEKPELVPFRLTHNMRFAMGAYDYEGPFRKSCELTLDILRQHEDTLMTILETFLYDPTTDFIGKKKRSATIVPDTPEGVLESVRNKVRGLLPTESVPLSVEGYIEVLIKQAIDPFKLASMYVGWCSFF